MPTPTPPPSDLPWSAALTLLLVATGCAGSGEGDTRPDTAGGPGTGSVSAAPDPTLAPWSEARVARIAGRLVEDEGFPSRDSAAVHALYQRRDGRPLWTDEDGLTAAGRQAMEELRSVDREGLEPSTYGARRLEALRDRMAGGSAPPSLRPDLDVGLSAGLLRYGVHRARGRLERAPYDEGWKLDSVDAVVPPDSVTSAPALLEWVESRAPGARQYRTLQTAVRALRQIDAAGGWPRVEAGDEIWEEGDSSRAVASLRARLEASVSPEESRAARAGRDRPRHFDSRLREALEHAQERHAVSADGVLGPATAQALNVPVSHRIRQLEITLERWRWMPRSEGSRRLLVAVPLARLHALEEGRPVLSMDVVVGESGWETTLFQDVVDRIVVNPYWTVPRSILAEEVLPQVREDRGYLEEENMEVIEYTGDGVRVVDPSTVDWEGMDPETTPYWVRERPGPHNALGRMKFLFPNEHSIYLHDTPQEQLFEEPLRAFSHGCVRVARPFDLARYLLDHASDRSMDHLRELLATRERNAIHLDHGIPVFLVYLTAWSDPDGVPSFGRDLYDRDPALLEALARARS